MKKQSFATCLQHFSLPFTSPILIRWLSPFPSSLPSSSVGSATSAAPRCAGVTK